MQPGSKNRTRLYGVFRLYEGGLHIVLQREGEMKQRLLTMLLVLTYSIIVGASLCQANPPVIDTTKSMYNLDPYFWVYSASLYDVRGVTDLWPAEGHDININFMLRNYSGTSSQLTFTVDGLAYPVEGVLEEDPDIQGVFHGSFVVSEASVGASEFKPGAKDAEGNLLVPKEVTLRVLDDNGVVSERAVMISRWGCDRCHLSQADAVEVYPWCSPAGGPFGPHNWPNVLGRNDGRPGFTYENLTNVALTHTPTVGGYVTDRNTGETTWVKNPLDRPPYHQQTNPKLPGSEKCSPCHQGSGHVRTMFMAPGIYPWLSVERSLTVKCVFCHGSTGGYVPDEPRPLWENWFLKSWN